MILVLSDGKDSGPIEFRQRYVSQAEVIDRARNEDVMVYGIGMRSRPRQSQVGLGPGGLQAALLADLPDPGSALVAEHTGAVTPRFVPDRIWPRRSHRSLTSCTASTSSRSRPPNATARRTTST